jgi:hypothetical protein
LTEPSSLGTLLQKGDTKPSFGCVTCPRHGLGGKIQVKFYVEHWQPDKKQPVLCYLKAKDLPEPLQKCLSSYGLRFISRSSPRHRLDGSAIQKRGESLTTEEPHVGEDPM